MNRTAWRCCQVHPLFPRHNRAIDGLCSEANQVPVFQCTVLLYRPEELAEGAPGGLERRAFNLHAWADRFGQPRPRSARQPLTSIAAHTSSQACLLHACFSHLLQLPCAVLAHFSSSLHF